MADQGRDQAGGAGPVRPEPLVLPEEVAVPSVPEGAGDAFRLVASRTLYDRGAAVSAVPALAGLVVAGTLRANPADLDDLGVAPHGRVRLRSASATVVLPVAPDPSLPRRVVAAEFNIPLAADGDATTVADLIDIGQPVVELRMEAL